MQLAQDGKSFGDERIIRRVGDTTGSICILRLVFHTANILSRIVLYELVGIIIIIIIIIIRGVVYYTPLLSSS